MLTRGQWLLLIFPNVRGYHSPIWSSCSPACAETTWFAACVALGGGYRLSRDSQNIFVAQVIDAVNESVDATRCHGDGGCQQGVKCLTHHLWTDLSKQIHEFLGNISLSDLVAKREVQNVAVRQDEQQGQDNKSVINSLL